MHKCALHATTLSGYEHGRTGAYRCCGCGMRSYKEFKDTDTEVGSQFQAKHKAKVEQYGTGSKSGSGLLAGKSAG